MSMSKRKISLVPGEYFHLYNRGNSKQKIFLDDEDRNRFVKLLYISNSKSNFNFRNNIVNLKIDAWDFERGDTIVSIGAWVLMPNHFHIYITSPRPGLGEEVKEGFELPITLFIRKVCVGYASYFNKKYNRTGSLFEGKFKAVHVEDDIQAKYLFSYIHLNPIKLIDPTWKELGIKDINKSLSFLDEYKWSSYSDYFGLKRKENIILNRENFPDYFSNIGNFNKEILEWLKFKEL
jgi:putative transposase